MDFYAKSAATALRLIAKFGGNITIKHTDNTVDPVAGTVVKSETSQVLKAVLLPITSMPKQVLTEADNRLIEAMVFGKDRFILAAAKGATFEPNSTDIITVNDELYSIIGCVPLKPTTTAIIYKIGAKFLGNVEVIPEGGDFALLDGEAFTLIDGSGFSLI